MMITCLRCREKFEQGYNSRFCGCGARSTKKPSRERVKSANLKRKKDGFFIYFYSMRRSFQNPIAQAKQIGFNENGINN